MPQARDILNRLGSLRLTLPLLLLLAATSTLGTFLPQGRSVAQYEEFAGVTAARLIEALSLGNAYHSLWYRVLLLLLSINMVSCMSSRIPGMISSLRGEAALRRKAVWQGKMDEDTEARLSRAFRSRGFREGTRAGRRILSRGGSVYALILTSHLSILIIMAFSALGSAFGFIGTQRVFVGDSTRTYFNWKTMSDTRLPFLLVSEDLVKIPYPVALKIGVKEASSGRKIKLITTHVGDDFRVPGLPGRIEITGFQTEDKRLNGFWVNGDGQRAGIGPDGEIGNSGLVLIPVAFAVFPEKQVLARTSLVKDNQVLASSEISVNHPMKFQGLNIFLTDYGTDPFGLPYVGYQIVKDPGRTGLWVGCVLFLLSMTGALFVRHRCVVLDRDSGIVRIHLSARGTRSAAEEEVHEVLNLFTGEGAHED